MLAAVRQGSTREWLPILVGLNVACVGMVVHLRVMATSTVALFLLGLVGTVLVASALAAVAAPVTPRPVGRVELGLRVALLSPAVGAGLYGAASVVVADGRSPSWGRFGLFVGSFWLVLSVVAAVSWKESPRSSRLHSASDDRPLPPVCAGFKRTVDVVVATVALVVALPVIAGAALAISIESPGGWLFTQTRLGANGRPFRLYKLRTMVSGNDDAQHRAYVASLILGQGAASDGLFKLVNDPRRTRVGSILRRFSIDELPQLWNVLKGDMSLIGPRPPLPSEAELYDEATWSRMAVSPGLTGLWQVSGRSRLTFAEMVALDVRYWQNWSPLLDMRILLRTPRAVLFSDTA